MIPSFAKAPIRTVALMTSLSTNTPSQSKMIRPMSFKVGPLFWIFDPHSSFDPR
jgi:hypothetical protein